MMGLAVAVPRMASMVSGANAMDVFILMNVGLLMLQISYEYGYGGDVGGLKFNCDCDFDCDCCFDFGVQSF